MNSGFVACSLPVKLAGFLWWVFQKKAAQEAAAKVLV